MPDPSPLDIFDQVYEEITPELAEQRDQFAAYLASFETQHSRTPHGGAAMTAITLAKGVTMGLRAAMEADPKVIIMGEDVGKLGGVFRVTDGLQKDFGEDRVIDTPLAESGILGTAVGLAMRGYRPVCEIQFDGFVYPAYDQIVSQVAKLHFRSRGQIKMPIVIRIPFGGGIGAVEHHSESPEAYFAHTAGLKVVACSNPVDAYWMIQQAIAADDPIVFLEPKRRYWEKGELDDRRRRPTRCSPPGSCRPGSRRRPCSRTGRWSRPRCEAAAAAADDGTEPRGHRPADAVAARPGARSTSRCARPATPSSSTRHRSPSASAREIAARITEECFYSLEAPVLRVGGFDTPYPPSRIEEEYLPDLDRVLDAVDRSLAY